jgi:hypothetical protein
MMVDIFGRLDRIHGWSPSFDGWSRTDAWSEVPNYLSV